MGLHLVVLYVKDWNISFWSRVVVHYRVNKKYKKCLGKLCFKRQLQDNCFLVELIFILVSHINQGDSLITCELDYFDFAFKPLPLNHQKIVKHSTANQRKEEKGSFDVCQS